MDMYAYLDMCETLFLTSKTFSLLEETKPNTDSSLNWISFCQATWGTPRLKETWRDVKKAQAPQWERDPWGSSPLGRSCPKFPKLTNLDEQGSVQAW